MNLAQIAFWMFAGAAALFAGRFVYLWVKKGWSWGVAKLKSWWSKAKIDLVALEGRVTALEEKLGLKKTPAPASAPAPVTAAPAA